MQKLIFCLETLGSQWQHFENFNHTFLGHPYE